MENISCVQLLKDLYADNEGLVILSVSSISEGAYKFITIGEKNIKIWMCICL